LFFDEIYSGKSCLHESCLAHFCRRNSAGGCATTADSWAVRIGKGVGDLVPSKLCVLLSDDISALASESAAKVCVMPLLLPKDAKSPKVGAQNFLVFDWLCAVATAADWLSLFRILVTARFDWLAVWVSDGPLDRCR
jgi:hypothetical protein